MTGSETNKLELFEQEIMLRAGMEKEEILRATEEQKRGELEQEENRLLEELYRKIQSQINEIKTRSIQDLSKETLELKKQLYRQREQYLTELLARARVELLEFAKGADYERFLLRKTAELTQHYHYEGSVLRLRTADLPYAQRLQELYGGCAVEADDESITIGGVILQNTARGIEVDFSLDAALVAQRGRFYENSGLNFKEAGETA